MLPERLATWCENEIGAFDVVADCAHDHGESAVWKIRAKKNGESLYVKGHRRDGKREREIWSYTHVGPLLPEAMPHLIAVRDEPPGALLLSALPGEPMEKVALSLVQEQAAWHQAGVALAKIHTITSPWFGRPDRNGDAQGDMQYDPAIFWEERLSDWIERAERGGYLTPEEIAFARTGAKEAGVFQDEPAVVCHHDFTPRNWIVSPETGEWLGVIDFENMCFDVAVADFKLHQDRFFTKRPDLKETFFAGYGKPLSDRQQAQLRFMHLHQGVSGVVWSREHNDSAFEAENHAILDRVRREYRKV